MSNSILVTKHTTVAQVANFLKTGSDDTHGKLVAKKTSEGTVLYFKNNKESNVFMKAFGFAEKRRNLARDTVSKMFSSVEGNLKKTFPDKDFGMIFTPMQELVTLRTGRSINRDTADYFGTILDGFHTAGKEAGKTDNTQQVKLEQQELPKEPWSKITDQIKLGQTEGEPKPMMEGGQGVKMPEFELNGSKYEPVKHLGTGGFGEVFMYQNKENPQEKIAFKVMNPNAGGPDGDKKIEEEILSHLEVSKGDNPSVLNMHGAVKLEGGALGIAMEVAPHGSLNTFAYELKRIEGEGVGKIPPALAKIIQLTLLKDAAQGLKHLHDKGMAHADFKAPNTMIGSDGRAKLIDFGETKKFDQIKPEEMSNVNAVYQSPELLNVKGVKERVESDFKTTRKTDFSDVFDQFSKAQSWGNGPEVSMLKASVMKSIQSEIDGQAYARLDELVDLKSFDQKANDSWGLGLIAAELFIGDRISSASGPMAVQFESRLRRAAALGTTPVGTQVEGKLQPGHLMNSTGDWQMDDVVDQLLDFRAGSRMGPSELLEHSIFDNEAIGSEPLRVLISEMAPYLNAMPDISTLNNDIKVIEDRHKRGDRNSQSEKMLQTKTERRDLLMEMITPKMMLFEIAKEEYFKTISGHVWKDTDK